MRFAQSARKPADPVTNSLAKGATPTATVDTPVVAIAQTPPLAWLQQLPIVGPVIVTPIFALIHQIPIIGDVLHPLIGYPLQPGLSAGAPLPRDVKVISFDGTQIYTHFMPVPSLGVLTVSSMQLVLPTADAAAISSPHAVQLTVAA